MLRTIRNILLPAICLLLTWAALPGQSFPTLRWQKFYGSEFDDEPFKLAKAPDGNLLMGGNIGTNDSGAGCTDVRVVKLDTNGRKIWERRFGGSGCDELRDFAVTPDSGLIFVGMTSSFIEHPEKGEGDYKGDYFVGKITIDGDIDWL